MKKNLLLLALSCPLFSFAQEAASASKDAVPAADFFVVSDSSFAFFRAAPGQELSAYSAPGGGRLLRQGSATASPAKWAFGNEKRPAFLMVKGAKAGAKVFPLEAPLFKVADLRKTPESALFRCTATARTAESVVAELWILGEKGWQKTDAKPLAETPSELLFEVASRAGVEAAQVRFVSGGNAYHTEQIFGDAAALFFTVYPNPALGRFTVSTASAGKLLVTDITGHVVHTATIAGGESTVSLPNAAPGTYFLQAVSAETGKVARASVKLLSE